MGRWFVIVVGFSDVALLGCEPGRDIALSNVTGYSECRIGRVVDGDTVDLVCANGAPRARLVGFDSPQLFSPRCREEAALARKAKGRLGSLLGAANSLSMRARGTDRCDRILVSMAVDDQDVADIMVREQLAVRCTGGRRIDWCSRLA